MAVGDASELKEGRNFVERWIVLWEYWGEMSERDPEKLRKWVDAKHGDGFAMFGQASVILTVDICPYF